MLTVDDYEQIRRKHLIDGMSQRAIARDMSLARNTVAKAIIEAIPPGYRLTKLRPKPKIRSGQADHRCVAGGGSPQAAKATSQRPADLRAPPGRV